jgi:hypothetical protein
VARAPSQSSESTTPTPDRRRDLVAATLACIVVIAFFAVAFGIRQFDVPVGDDSYFYVYAIRAAGRFGLADTHISARPAYPLTASTLASVIRSSPWATAVALPFSMAAATGLAAAALAARWGVRRWAGGTFALLTSLSIVIARLVAGRSENLMTVWLLIAALGVAVWGGGRKAGVAAALLLLGAGLTEWPFLAAFLAILGITLLVDRLAGRTDGPVRAVAASVRRARRAVGRRLREWRRTRRLARLLASPAPPPAPEPVPAVGFSLSEIALVAGVATAGVAFVVFGLHDTGPADAIQRLPPSTRFLPRLLAELANAWAVPSLVSVLVGWWIAVRLAPAGARAVRRLLSVWLAITAVVLAFGLTGVPLPTYRALTFAAPVALAVAASPILPLAEAARERSRSQRMRWAVAAIGLAALALLPPTMMWYRTFNRRTTPEQLAQIAAAGRYVATLPDDQSVVLVLDDPDVLRAYLYPRVIEAVVPPSRRARILVLPGRTEDALAGRPTIRGDETLRAVTRSLFDRIRPALEAGAPILVARDFDSSAFGAARIAGAPLVGEGIAVVRGPPPDPALAEQTSGQIVPLPPWWVLLFQAAGFLALLVGCGLGWARLAVPEAGALVHVGLAPAFGGAILAVLTVAVVNAGIAPWGGAGPPVVAGALALSAVVGLWPTTRRRSLAAPAWGR